MATETSIITNIRREKLCKITSGAITAMAKVTHIAFGDGGVDADKNPVAPLGTQTALKNEIGRYAIDGVTYLEKTTARYTVTIPKGDLVGQKISEAALIDEDGDLCAIKTMYEKGKDDGVIFTFVFDDEF